eukprot:UN09024
MIFIESSYQFILFLMVLNVIIINPPQIHHWQTLHPIPSSSYSNTKTYNICFRLLINYIFIFYRDNYFFFVFFVVAIVFFYFFTTNTYIYLITSNIYMYIVALSCLTRLILMIVKYYGISTIRIIA